MSSLRRGRRSIAICVALPFGRDGRPVVKNRINQSKTKLGEGERNRRFMFIQSKIHVYPMKANPKEALQIK
jgi:hypothetical protein